MTHMTISGLRNAYRSGAAKPSDVIRNILKSIDDDPAVWIERFTEEELLAKAVALDAASAKDLPLHGIPFAVKDNIDVKGLPTTAACPDYSYRPQRSAFVVELLEKAGAICLGKTNLDQFATGLVGVRSPYGIPQNPFHKDYIPGGSSSGSAVAVARGLAAFSLGTDTAGSGRVPAAFNNLFGWKPTRGLLSTSGVVPACRTLDCVSIFAHSAADLVMVMDVVARFDPADPFARNMELSAPRSVSRIGIPRADQCEFFGDKESAKLWDVAIQHLRSNGSEVVEVDFAPFLEAARLLYEGPWVAERYLAAKDLLERSPDSLHPVTREIISKGSVPSAAQTFEGYYRLAELRRRSEEVLAGVDILCTPTAGTIFRIEDVDREPIKLNSQLGYYTNFLNLLDLSGLAIPAGFRPDGLPFGMTAIARAGEDLTLLEFAGGTVDTPQTMEVAVCGAHMTGLPLNPQLLELGGRFVRSTKTSPTYRMFALDEKRPGLVRTEDGGTSLELEIWRLPIAKVGTFLSKIPTPLGLGRVFLEDGSQVCGFLCEASAVKGKPEVTPLGGWRAWLQRTIE